MTIYKVSFDRIDWDAYFSGSWTCACTAEEFFATKEKAEEFFATKEKAEEFIKAPLDEYVPTWKRYETIKEAGAGEIYEIEIESEDVEREVLKKIVDKMREYVLFVGKFDAKHLNVNFMYGIETVMEYLAGLISEEYHDEFEKEFMTNFEKA